jgi:hypothetical protein
MSKPTIISSRTDYGYAVVEWSDGIIFTFNCDAELVSGNNGSDKALPASEYCRRVIVSRTSAQSALAGCTVGA